MNKPLIAFVPGDVNGIGPELTAKVLSSPPTDMNIVLIGDEAVIEYGEQITGQTIYRAEITTEQLDNRDNINATDAIAFLRYGEEVQKKPDITSGQISAAAGKKSLSELAFAARLAKQGLVDGVCFAPLNKEAMKAGGMQESDELHHIASLLGYNGHISEINIMESNIWTSRVTSHVALRRVPDLITVKKIEASAKLLQNGLQRAGVSQPRIAVAALNPHGGDGGNFGSEEIDIIAPAVASLQAAGMNAVGPYPADTLFRRAIIEGIDGVVTMYHDQGQIALKLNGFERGVSVLGGLPVAIATPAHGTAFDIAGKNKTFTGATEQALKTLLRMATAVNNRGEKSEN